MIFVAFVLRFYLGFDGLFLTSDLPLPTLPYLYLTDP